RGAVQRLECGRLRRRGPRERERHVAYPASAICGAERVLKGAARPGLEVVEQVVGPAVRAAERRLAADAPLELAIVVALGVTPPLAADEVHEQAPRPALVMNAQPPEAAGGPRWPRFGAVDDIRGVERQPGEGRAHDRRIVAGPVPILRLEVRTVG